MGPSQFAESAGQFDFVIPADNIEDLAGKLQQANFNNIGLIYIVDHGTYGAQWLGNSDIRSDSAAWKSVASSISNPQSGGGIVLMGCNVALGVEGSAYIQELANNGGVPVIASMTPVPQYIIPGAGIWKITTPQTGR